MATLTSTACHTSASGFFITPPKYLETGAIARTVVFNANSTLFSTGDIVQMMPIPKGAMIDDLNVVLTYNATSATLAVTVGDGNSAARYLGSTSAVTVVRTATAGGIGYSYSTDDTIDVVIGTAASASSSAVIRLSVLYHMDNSTGT